MKRGQAVHLVRAAVKVRVIVSKKQLEPVAQNTFADYSTGIVRLTRLLRRPWIPLRASAERTSSQTANMSDHIKPAELLSCLVASNRGIRINGIHLSG